LNILEESLKKFKIVSKIQKLKKSIAKYVGFAKMPKFLMPAPTASIPATAGTAGSAGTKKRFFLVPKCTHAADYPTNILM
jgi:alcohol dehydrogenase class IV